VCGSAECYLVNRIRYKVKPTAVSSFSLRYPGSDSSKYLRGVRISFRESLKHSIQRIVYKGEEVYVVEIDKCTARNIRNFTGCIEPESTYSRK